MAEKEAARAAGYETVWQQENMTRATELDARVRKEKEALDEQQAQLDQSEADKRVIQKKQLNYLLSKTMPLKLQSQLPANLQKSRKRNCKTSMHRL